MDKLKDATEIVGNDLDLTKEPPSRGFQVSDKEYDPEPRRESVRSWLAFGVLGLFYSVVIGAFVSIWLGYSDTAFRIVEMLLSPVAALCGGVIAFYYATKSLNKD